MVLKFPCDSCDFSATTTRNLKWHIESKHEGVRYPCDKWDDAATEAGKLKRHIESIHEE